MSVCMCVKYEVITHFEEAWKGILDLNICVCVRACIYTYVYMYIHKHTHVYVCICACMQLFRTPERQSRHSQIIYAYRKCETMIDYGKTIEVYSLCMYVCMYVVCVPNAQCGCMEVRLYVCVSAFLSGSLCIYIYIYIYILVCVCIWMHAFVYLYTYIYYKESMYVCVRSYEAFLGGQPGIIAGYVYPCSSPCQCTCMYVCLIPTYIRADAHQRGVRGRYHVCDRFLLWCGLHCWYVYMHAHAKHLHTDTFNHDLASTEVART